MSNKSLKYSMAVNLSGQLISASNADKKEQYHCLECQTKMVPRQGEIKRHHFAHVQSDRECNPESYIHKAGKQIIAEKINQGLVDNNPVIFDWLCPYCKRQQELNIIGNRFHTEMVASVKLEQTLKNNDGSIARPDIVLSNRSEQPIVAVEIINTHAPENKTLSILSELGLSVLGVNVAPGDDLVTLWRDKIPGQWFILFWGCKGCADAINEEFARMT